MKLRVIVKSHASGSNEEIYFCTDTEDFELEPEEFFFMDEGDSIDIDQVIDGLDYLDKLLDLPLPFDRPLKAV